MSMKIGELSKLAGVSVRTLHHYDALGLLVPQEQSPCGYRLYSQKNLDTLQDILLFKELGFPLSEINRIIHDPSFDRLTALQAQRKLMEKNRIHLEAVLATLETTIRHLKGETTMSNKEKFDFNHNPYEQEARDRWGDKAVDDSNRRLSSKTPQEMNALQNDIASSFTRLAAIRHIDPCSPEAQKAIGEWFRTLNTMGTYTKEAFAGLGQMYIEDVRFTKNIDKYGQGLAAFLAAAMQAYAK
jgi:DNA-binding transcriptional MerR regulator